MKELVQNVVENTLQSLLEKGELDVDVLPRFNVELPKKKEHGDFATNVALVIGKGKGGRKVAELLKANLIDPDGVVAKLDIAGPGFINFTLSDSIVQAQVKRTLDAGDAFGRSPSTGKKVNIEFVSANPTGPLHLGHARGAFMGDAVARLLDAAGHDVTREFYINDAGNQVEILGRSVHSRYRELFGEEVTLGEGQYPGKYIIAIAEKLRDEDGAKWMGKEESEWLPRCMEIAIRENVNAIKETLEYCNISFDIWSSESTLHAAGDVLGIVEKYKGLGKTYEGAVSKKVAEEGKVELNAASKAAIHSEKQKGGTFLTTSEVTDDDDRIILRQDGTPVYLTADLAYHAQKFARSFDRMIDVWGADHAGHVPRIQSGMRLLGLDDAKLDFLLVQIVRLMKDGKELRQSKRAGEVYELKDFVDDIGPDAARFIYLQRSANAQFDFDIADALKQSNDNPVFYCQMGHARCANVLKKAVESSKEFVGKDVLTDEQLARLVLPEERDILKKLSELPEVVRGAGDALEPHRLLYYCQDLISDFHGYFTKYRHDQRIISDDDALTQARLGMVAALKVGLENALGLLGINAPDYMKPRSDDAAEAEDG
ncbi:MAG: arginine--tRNA ligase [Deltaproteobacteria bacterium]|nr:arginine--tRNA ligase [Deltaproteobacteria bacterium]